MAPTSVASNGGAVPADVARAPAGPPARSVRSLPEAVGGLCVIGTLTFVGTLERSPRTVAVDVSVRDADGRQDVIKCSGWKYQGMTDDTPKPTALGRALESGALAGLVGSEVCVSVSARAYKESVQLNVEGIHPLTRVAA